MSVGYYNCMHGVPEYSTGCIAFAALDKAARSISRHILNSNQEVEKFTRSVIEVVSTFKSLSD